VFLLEVAMSRPVKVNLSDRASDELKRIAQELDVSESEVLRKGLALMKVYADAHKMHSDPKLMLKEGNELRELIIAV
jgi:hypothetical protein